MNAGDELLRGAVYAAFDVKPEPRFDCQGRRVYGPRASHEFHEAVEFVATVYVGSLLVEQMQAIERAQAERDACAAEELAWYAHALRNVGGLP